MGVQGPGERSNICGEGCAMSSLSMAANGLGMHLPDGREITPGTMNNFLINHSLYVCAGGDCNNLRLNAIEAVGPNLKLIGELPKPSFQEISSGLASEATIYLAHVHNNHHFILLLAADGEDSFIVHDPSYPYTVYPYANITDIIMFSVQTQPWVNTPRQYPLYKQCDPQWANNVMINHTICQVGCLMSSISMALNSFNVSIDGSSATPASLNTWLIHNQGYDAGDDLNEEVLPNLAPGRVVWPADGMHRSNDLDMATVRAYLLIPRVVIANVMHGGHFVLVTGFDWNDEDAILVNDSGFNTTRYSHSSDVVGWRIFDMV